MLPGPCHGSSILVGVRLGDAPAGDFNQRFWELLMAVAPASPARR
jgi:hypothetical protein